MSDNLVLNLTSRTTLVCVLAFCSAIDKCTLAQTSLYVEISTDMPQITTILSAAGCQSSDTEVCLSLNRNNHNHTVVQDSLSGPDSNGPVYNVTSINGQPGSENSTTGSAIPTENELETAIQYMIRVNWYMIVILYPSLGAIGLVSNILSGIILVRSGLGKPSNIFLLGMAVADSLCLLGAANIPYILMHVPKIFPFGTYFWEYTRSASFACYVFGTAIRCLGIYGVYVSAALCTVVTIERLMAVYFPLQFTSILTPTRAWLVCCGCFLIWLPYLVFAGITWFVFDYRFYPQWNIYGGEMKFQNSALIELFEFYMATLFGKCIPLVIVTVGSILISVKVSITLRKRRKMVSTTTKTASSGSRTTTTLLVVCLTFSVTKIVSLPIYFYSITDIHSMLLWNFYAIAQSVSEYINGFCNFFIYVFLNKKYRRIFLSTISRKKRQP